MNQKDRNEKITETVDALFDAGFRIQDYYCQCNMSLWRNGTKMLEQRHNVREFVSAWVYWNDWRPPVVVNTIMFKLFERSINEF